VYNSETLSVVIARSGATKHPALAPSTPPSLPPLLGRDGERWVCLASLAMTTFLKVFLHDF
jgi:hypothetical protein